LTVLIHAATVVGVSESGAAAMATATDAELAMAITRLDAEAAGAAEDELYRRFAPRVRLFGLKHLRDETAAEDLAQQVVLMTIERLRAGEVRNLDQIGSFILGASRMTCGGLRRTERRRQDLHSRFDAREATDEASTPDIFGVAGVERCLATLRERDRAILIETFYAERATDQIAAAFGMTAGAVRVGRHRALAQMRECVNAGRRM
jgi:RNA polymerase sigma-70 factor (ECF subfamily)